MAESGDRLGQLAAILWGVRRLVKLGQHFEDSVVRAFEIEKDEGVPVAPTAQPVSKPSYVRESVIKIAITHPFHANINQRALRGAVALRVTRGKPQHQHQ